MKLGGGVRLKGRVRLGGGVRLGECLRVGWVTFPLFLSSDPKSVPSLHSMILRKILRVVDSLPLSANDIYSVRSAHGTFANTLQVIHG